jgi:hypothetical protein
MDSMRARINGCSERHSTILPRSHAFASTPFIAIRQIAEREIAERASRDPELSSRHALKGTADHVENQCAS